MSRHIGIPADRSGRSPRTPVRADAPRGYRATPTNAAIEFVLVTAQLFGAVTITWWIRVGPAADGLGSPRAELATTALAVAILMTVLIRSPWGRRSGAHMNPAITLALWLMRAFPGRDVVPYLTAQLAGSVAGTALGRLAWGRASARPPVSYGVLTPAPTWNGLQVGLAEAGCLMLITWVVGFILSRPEERIRAILAYVVPTLVGAVIVVFGPLSGGSANPARQLGPALWSGNTKDLAVYLLAPMIGATAGALAHRGLVNRRPLTHRICGSVASQPALRPDDLHAATPG